MCETGGISSYCSDSISFDDAVSRVITTADVVAIFFETICVCFHFHFHFYSLFLPFSLVRTSASTAWLGFTQRATTTSNGTRS
jgi:hypothetical protein